MSDFYNSVVQISSPSLGLKLDDIMDWVWGYQENMVNYLSDSGVSNYAC